jgi:vacuolar-type H+-ATPase subunit I/STV1
MSNSASIKPGPLTDWAGRLTLLGAEAAYVGLAVYLAWITFAAADGQAPDVPNAIAGAAGALATAFGVGYATVIDNQAAHVDSAALVAGSDPSAFSRFVNAIGSALSIKRLLGVGVILYMLASMLIGVAYVTNSAESPGIVRTIAVAFGGYVIGFVGIAYKGYRSS